MLKQFTVMTIYCASFFLLFNCGNVANETINWFDSTEANTNLEVEGKFNHLENDNIKVFLPKSFKRYNAVEYEKLLKSRITQEEASWEIARLAELRNMEGDLYLFFDDNSYSTFTVNTMPYMPFSKQDAKFLLGMIRKNHDLVYETTKTKYTKTTAKFNQTADTQVFKAVYEVQGPKFELPVYNHIYVMSSKRKTIFVNFTSVHGVSFDPYVLKTRF